MRRELNGARPRPAIALFGLAVGTIACGFFPFGQEAPDECGFPDGTALSFAGRSTTAALGVQEVQGDAMSDDPADIYVTRDAFDQGELHGRLVCAIYVNDPGFVEVTVHPADVAPVVEEVPAPRPTVGLSQDEAVEAAMAEVPEQDGWDFEFAHAGPLSEMPVTPESHGWSIDIPGDRWVWRLIYARGDQGFEVYVDFADGAVLGTGTFIIN